VSIIIGRIAFPGVPIHFDSSEFDIILEMVWLCTCGVKIGCDDPKVISRDEQGREICFMVKERKKLCPLHSVMQPSELLCQGYIVH